MKQSNFEHDLAIQGTQEIAAKVRQVEVQRRGECLSSRLATDAAEKQWPLGSVNMSGL